MYLSFYGLAEKPFSITPDPRYLFLGGRHAEALAHLLYGVTEAGGFIQLTGAIGYYSMLAMTVNACELEAAPGAEVLKV